MNEFMNIYIDEIKGIIIISYESEAYLKEELQSVSENLVEVYGCKVVTVPNAKITFK